MIIAQLSDLHICDEGTLYQGVVSTNEMARNAVDHVNALNSVPDLVILTGDITEDGTASQYAAAYKILSDLRAPLYVMPGNHDNRDVLRSSPLPVGFLPPRGPCHFVLDGGAVRLVCVDVTVPGAHRGFVDEATLIWLGDVLHDNPDKPVIIAMHQPPFACGISYLDPYMCHGAERLERLVQQHSNVERVICGHVHRSIQRRWAGTFVVTSPATATQIALDIRPSASPASYLEPPGYLLHCWSELTGLVTHLVPVGVFAGPFAFA